MHDFNILNSSLNIFLVIVFPALLPSSSSSSGGGGSSDGLKFTNNHLRWLAYARTSCFEDQMNKADKQAAADDDDHLGSLGSSKTGAMKISADVVKTHILPYMRGGLEQWSESLTGK